MSNGGVRRTRIEEICRVQDLVERKIVLYMTRNMTRSEIVTALSQEDNVEHLVTDIVWTYLEQLNKEFFDAYRARLMHQRSSEYSFIPTPKGWIDKFGFGTLAEAPLAPGPSMNWRPAIQTTPNNVYTNNGASIVQPWMQGPNNMGGHTDMPQNNNNSLNEGMVQGANTSQFLHGRNIGHPEHQNTLGPNVSFSGLLRPMPQRFSLSDIRADFTASKGKLQSYSGSPFLRAADANFQTRGRQQANNGNMEITMGTDESVGNSMEIIAISDDSDSSTAESRTN